MGQHYTKNTVTVSHWCKKCSRMTTHQVLGGKLGACVICLERLNQAADARKLEVPAAKQESLFG